ncbi:unnamed protein product [Rhodiola kirilowii]
MAVSEVELVLEFLRKNGLTEAESALKLDLKEKNEVEVLEFEIPTSSQRWEGLGECSRLKSMSEDEFVSVDSSSSNVCSSGTCVGLYWMKNLKSKKKQAQNRNVGKPTKFGLPTFRF